MGGKREQAYSDEFLVHVVSVSAFYIDGVEIKNKQFLSFVEGTDYLNVAERAVDWDELKLQLPPNTSRPPDSLLVPGSLLFKPISGSVDLSNPVWWCGLSGADWPHVKGRGSSIEHRMSHQVVYVLWQDEVPMWNGLAKDSQLRRSGSGLRWVAQQIRFILGEMGLQRRRTIKPISGRDFFLMRTLKRMGALILL